MWSPSCRGAWNNSARAQRELEQQRVGVLRDELKKLAASPAIVSASSW
jgi:hypothetical protein